MFAQTVQMGCAGSQSTFEKNEPKERPKTKVSRFYWMTSAVTVLLLLVAIYVAQEPRSLQNVNPKQTGYT